MMLVVRKCYKLVSPRSPAWALLVVTISCALRVYAADVEQGVLHWQNGDQLSGRLLSADAQFVEWQPRLFSTPFRIDIGVLSAIQYPTPVEPLKSDLPFRVVTVNNDVVLGELVGIFDQQLVITNPRHGRLQLDREQLIGLQRHNRLAAGSVGLGLLTDWKTLHRGRQISEWSRGVDGRIGTKVTGAELYRDLRLTSVSEIDLEFSWNGKPGFMISFAGPDALRLSKQVVKLETWENDLVLQTLGANGDFEVIQTIPADAQSLALRLQWNPGSGELSVYSATGQLLGRMKGDPLPSMQLSGLYIQNKGASLDVTRLRANGWEGAGEKLPGGAVRVRLADASTVTGKIIDFDSAAGRLQLMLASGTSRYVAVEQIDSLDLGNEPIENREVEPVRVTFLDGTQISGSLKSVQEGVVTVKTAYSREPISARLNGIFSLRFAPSAPECDTAKFDVIHLDQGRLRGELVSIVKWDNSIGWRPVGSQNAAKLPNDQPLRITRADAGTEDDMASENHFLDRIFLRNGDAVPCNIHGIDATHLHVDVPLTENSRIDRNMAVAVEFGTFAGSQSGSFADPQWVMDPEKKKVVARSETEVEVRDAVVFGYDNIRDADEIAFDIKWNMVVPVFVRVNLFAASTRDVGPAPSVMLYRTSGTRVMIQAIQGFAAGGVGNVRGVAPIEARNGRNSFRFRLRRDKITVYENDKELLEVPFDRTRTKGKSLSINVQRLNVNNQPVVDDDNEKSAIVTFCNPSVRRAGGDVLNVLVDENELARLLTIPRFRKQSPPSEVLVGRNGDLLRGRLISLDDKQATFVSRLEEIVVPRDRLAGIIWPQTEEAVAETALADARLARILFTDGSVMRMTLEQMIDDALVGVHPALGQVAIPFPLTRELSLGGIVDSSENNPFAAWVTHAAAEPQFAQINGAEASAHGNSVYGLDSPLVQQPAPRFAADMLDGSRFRVAAQEGKVVVLDFWATWCGPCVKSMPHTMNTIAEFSDHVTLVAVNQLETADTIHKFLDAREWQLNVALDRDGQIGKLFQVDSIPQLVVIDGTGTVQRVFVGDRGDLAEQLKQALIEVTSDKAAR